MSDDRVPILRLLDNIARDIEEHPWRSRDARIARLAAEVRRLRLLLAVRGINPDEQ